MIILQEATCNASLSESGMANSLKGAKVLKRGGTTHRGEKKVKVEALSRRGMGIIHPPKGKGVLPPHSPNVILLVPDQLRGKVLVEKVMKLIMLCIELEPSSECGIYICLLIHHILKVASSWIENDRLLTREVNLKPNNGRDMLLHLKHVHVPEGFTAADIVCIQVVLDLICASAKLHGDPIMALVYILVDVLNGLDR